MKKIIPIFLILLCSLTACKKEEEKFYHEYVKYEALNSNTNINYDFGTLVLTGAYKEVITTDDVPWFYGGNVSLFYDEDFTIPYNNEKLEPGTTIYVKLKNGLKVDCSIDEFFTSINAFYSLLYYPSVEVESIEKVSVNEYCGIYNGCLVYSLTGNYGQVSRTETYGNVSIYYSDGRSILYFKDKVCYPLIDAYNNGFVTEDEISKIATAFYNMS